MIEAGTRTGSTRLLWTGGWDSTFQLLQLLIVQAKPVSPLYLIDETRPSTGVELLTMKRIKAAIARHFPASSQLLQPTWYFAVSDIAANAAIGEAYRRLRQRSFIGDQYDWLARFCAAQGLDDVQLCIHRDDKAHAVLAGLVAPGPSSDPPAYRLGGTGVEADVKLLFRYFSFPLFDLAKTEMHVVARDKGFGPIMEMTWFCHNPTSAMTPCGVCNPCLYTIEEGLGWRVPRMRRLLSPFARSVIRPARRLSRKLRQRFAT